MALKPLTDDVFRTRVLVPVRPYSPITSNVAMLTRLLGHRSEFYTVTAFNDSCSTVIVALSGTIPSLCDYPSPGLCSSVLPLFVSSLCVSVHQHAAALELADEQRARDIALAARDEELAQLKTLQQHKVPARTLYTSLPIRHNRLLVYILFQVS